jgi:16S rRNA (adenine(1408)-N(1))-methyltransferase
MQKGVIRIIGKKTEVIEKLPIFEKVEIDLGTGDGRYIYENAKTNPDTLLIGVDTLGKVMEAYSSKAQREKLTNAYFVVGHAEKFLTEFSNAANKIVINFPWGSLLGLCINPSKNFILELKRVLKPNGTVEMIFGYSAELEQQEVTRLNLPEITKEMLANQVVPKYLKEGFELMEITELFKDDLATTKSSWGKKLRFGKDRPVYKLVLSKIR